MKNWIRVLSIVVVVALLVGCTGGGGEKNKTPGINAFSPALDIVEALLSGEVSFSVTAVDPDGDSLEYLWEQSGGGQFTEKSGSKVTWKAPNEPGEATVKVTVSDGKGGATSHLWQIRVVEEQATSVLITVLDEAGNGLEGIPIWFVDGTPSIETDGQGIVRQNLNTNETIITPQINSEYYSEPGAMIVRAGDQPTFVVHQANQTHSLVELSFNPVVFADSEKLNPFSSATIREAMNLLVERDQIAGISRNAGNDAQPALTWIHPNSFDFEFMGNVLADLDALYAYDKDAAEATIREEMEDLGAELVDGTWHYMGKEVTLTFISRSDDERKEIGDYIASELESIGFMVEIQYKGLDDALEIWRDGDPYDGQWHMAMGGWGSGNMNGLRSFGVADYYTSIRLGWPLWNAYDPSPELLEAAQLLLTDFFPTLLERKEVFERGLELALQDSVRIWLITR
ncbi:MAG: PKD domain-containing protein [Firmicutes bacterium]|nr:PKD domain-containing protein [Bacillota bacterium]